MEPVTSEAIIQLPGDVQSIIGSVLSAVISQGKMARTPTRGYRTHVSEFLRVDYTSLNLSRTLHLEFV